MKVQDLNEAKEFVEEVVVELRHILKWPFFTSFACFYLAYFVMANYTLVSYQLCAAGLGLLFLNYNSLQVSIFIIVLNHLIS